MNISYILLQILHSLFKLMQGKLAILYYSTPQYKFVEVQYKNLPVHSTLIITWLCYILFSVLDQEWIQKNHHNFLGAYILGKAGLLYSKTPGFVWDEGWGCWHKN